MVSCRVSRFRGLSLCGRGGGGGESGASNKIDGSDRRPLALYRRVATKVKISKSRCEKFRDFDLWMEIRSFSFFLSSFFPLSNCTAMKIFVESVA